MHHADEDAMEQLKRKSFGDLIRSARQARDLSQAALARAAKTSPVFISQIETAQRLPSDRVARRLAAVLGLHWQEILRNVYELRSPDASELFEAAASSLESEKFSIYDLPAVRSLLLQLAGLNLRDDDIEKLARNWSSDLTILESLSKSRAQ